MSSLPDRPNIDQLRRQAKDLLQEAKDGAQEALARLRGLSDQVNLATAQLAIARDYGFESWTKLKTEVERRVALDSRDPAKLKELIDEQPELATSEMQHQCGGRPSGPTPLGYVAMMRYDAAEKVWRDQSGTGAIAKVLIDAGAPVDGEPGATETPLITAASYGDAEVAAALIKAGANLDTTASADGGGVPEGTALRHAAVFGMTDVVDLLVAAGAQVGSIAEAAAAGDLAGWLSSDTSTEDRVRALVMAADHERLDVIDQLLDAGTPIDATDPWTRQALRTAASNGRVASVRHLLTRGADPNDRDGANLTALDYCRRDLPADDPTRAEIEDLLAPVTG